MQKLKSKLKKNIGKKRIKRVWFMKKERIEKYIFEEILRR
jgi:hypothetical protein